MSAPSTQPPRRGPSAASLAARRWMLAGLAGMSFSVAVAFSGLFRQMPPAVAASLTIACGWLMLLVMSPWRIMRTLDVDQRPQIRELNTRLRLMAEGNRNIPLKDLIVEGDDDLAQLSRTVHDLAAEAHARRQNSRMLEKRLGHDVARETKRATAHLERQVTTDPLTGLGNRRALDQRFTELLAVETGGHRALVIMAIDVDRFKEVNDSLGHEVGDRCLRFLAEVLKTGLRRDDCPIRLGGDEFIVLMPDQSLDVARAVAMRLGTLFGQMPWPHAGLARPTLSFGLARHSGGPLNDLADLLRQADAALYGSKQAGRAAVTAFGERRPAA